MAAPSVAGRRWTAGLPRAAPDRCLRPGGDRGRVAAVTDPDPVLPRGGASRPTPARQICGRCPVRQPCLAYAPRQRHYPRRLGAALAERERRVLRVSPGRRAFPAASREPGRRGCGPRLGIRREAIGRSFGLFAHLCDPDRTRRGTDAGAVGMRPPGAELAVEGHGGRVHAAFLAAVRRPGRAVRPGITPGGAREGRLAERLTDHHLGRGARLTQVARRAGGAGRWVLADVERGGDPGPRGAAEGAGARPRRCRRVPVAARRGEGGGSPRRRPSSGPGGGPRQLL